MGADLPYLQLPSTDCECVECERRRKRDGVIGRRKVVFGRGWLRLLATFHLLSLFVFACCICSTRSLSSTTTISSTTQSSTTSTDKDVYLEEEHVSLDSTSSSQVDNPLLRHQRKTPQEQCHIWNSNTPADLCARGRWARLRLMRDLSLFSRDCTSELSNVRLAELFRLEWRYIKSEVDLLSQTEQLKPQGRDCVLGAPQSSQCLACFGRIGNSLQQLDRAYKAFDRTLQRFDCMLAVDSSSATRPFSPNGTCLDCKVDFAGHPAFQCRDLHIPQSTSTGSVSSYQHHHEPDKNCHCIHPCDLHHLPPQPLTHSPSSKSAQPHDFFSAPEHCQSRQTRCRQERQQKLSEHPAYPTGATHQKAASMLNSDSDTQKTGRSAEGHDQRRKHRHQSDEMVKPQEQLDYKKFRRRNARNTGATSGPYFGGKFLSVVWFVLLIGLFEFYLS